MFHIEVDTSGETPEVNVRDDEYYVTENVTGFTGKERLEKFSTQQQVEIFAEGVALGMRIAREFVQQELTSKFKGMSNGMTETVHT
jgi:hypothetical protein